jgi:hypothetical protein
MVNTKTMKGESGSSKKQITNEVVTHEYTVPTFLKINQYS